MGRVIVITSGKGGTGKSTLCAGLALALAELGQRVLCIDGDCGLRNLDLALGLSDRVLMDFMDVLEGRIPLEQAAVCHPDVPTLFLLTAPLQLPEPLPQDEFRALLSQGRQVYDVILIDSPAGLGAGFQLACCGVDEAILVSTGEPSALRDGQRVVSLLASTVPQIRLVLNRVNPRLFRRAGHTVDEVMDSLGLPLLGLVPEDASVSLRFHTGKSLLQGNQRGLAKACRNMAKRLTGCSVPLMKIGRRGLIV